MPDIYVYLACVGDEVLLLSSTRKEWHAEFLYFTGRVTIEFIVQTITLLKVQE